MEIDIPNNQPKAALWDLDGTIVDSAPYHKTAWGDIFNSRGIEFTDDIYKYTLGRKNSEIIRRYFRSNISQKELNIIAGKK